MIDPSMVPSLDPNPLPAPYWVFKLLLVVTFTLHMMAMNLMLGGAALALLARWRKGNAYGNRIFLDVAKKVPSLMAATISLGIAPLLFVQVLYGQYFYTSSILLAWPWFLVIVFVIAAYYGFYFVAYRGDTGRWPRGGQCCSAPRWCCWSASSTPTTSRWVWFPRAGRRSIPTAHRAGT